MNGSVSGTSPIDGPFSIAMFDYRRVSYLLAKAVTSEEKDIQPAIRCFGVCFPVAINFDAIVCPGRQIDAYSIRSG